MKKLIIQIPCYNEAAVLPLTLSQLPRQVAGFDAVEWLVIDDGSTDNTAAVAKSQGVDHLVRFNKNQGLARAFMAGLAEAVSRGAEVIVNLDADNQYRAADISKLTAPIVEHRADMVIGARPISQIKEFSFLKKILQRLGSYIVKQVSGLAIKDAPSGFRAISRETALKLNVFNNYTYTLETIIQAGRKNMQVISVDIGVNPSTRPSRLFGSIFSYIKKSIFIIIRISVIYSPFKFFISWGALFFALGLIPAVRFLWLFWSTGSAGHIQSLILAAILMIIGVQMAVLAFMGDIIAVNRSILEDIQYQTRKLISKKE